MVLALTALTLIALHQQAGDLYFGVLAAAACAGTMRQLDEDPRVRQVAQAQWYGAPSALYELRR